MCCTGTSSGELSPAQASGDSEGTPVHGWIKVEACLGDVGLRRAFLVPVCWCFPGSSIARPTWQQPQDSLQPPSPSGQAIVLMGRSLRASLGNQFSIQGGLAWLTGRSWHTLLLLRHVLRTLEHGDSSVPRNAHSSVWQSSWEPLNSVPEEVSRFASL